MFEVLISKVLNKVLGEFIENIDPRQLDISLFKGDVELKDMRLKADIFEALPVPFALTYGTIGRIQLSIPPMWALLSAPLLIEVSEVLAVVRTKHMSEWSEEAEVAAYRKANQGRLDKQEVIEENLEKLLSAAAT
jgi:vacuolar protein sorting-associated protein 13A/C